MNRILSIGLAVLVGTLAIAAPIAASLYISHQQSLDIEMASALSLADELQRRTDKTNAQIKAAFVELRKDSPADPCSEKHIQLMREIGITASYLQAVGHVANGRWMCSSLGANKNGIELGPVDYISSTGASVRMQVELSIAPEMRFIMIEKYGYAAIIHRELPLDVFEDKRDVSLASVNTSTGRLLLTRGVFKKEWLRPLPKDGYVSFFDGDYVVAIRRSKEFDWTSVAAVPVKYVDIRSKKLSMVLVPVGIAAGILLAIAFYFLAKQQTSWPSVLRLALKRKEFFLEYQPVIDLQTGHYVGAEALMRWRRANEKLVALGARYQQLDVSGYNYNSGARTQHYDESRVSPMAGLVWKTSDKVSLYANYIESLAEGPVAPNDGTVSNPGQIFDPYVSKQKEVGIKYDAGKIGGALAFFTTKKPSGSNSGGVYTIGGEDKHQGAELTVYGQAVRSLKVLGGVTWLDAKQERTVNGANDGKKVIGVPDIQANAGVEWDVTGLQGLSFDTQIVYTGSSYANATNTLRVPSWTRLDLGTRYVTEISNKVVTLRARVNNVTDRDYWASVGGYPGNGYLVLGTSRTFSLTASIDF